MKPHAPSPSDSAAPRDCLSGAVARLKRLLVAVSALLVAAQALWVVGVGADRPVLTLLVGAAATTALLSSIWIILGRMVRSGFTALAAWVAGGYLLRLGIGLVALLAGRAAGLDTKVIGVSFIVAIVAGMLCEVGVLARARILTVEPDGPGA